MILTILGLFALGAAFMASVPFRIAMLDGARVRYQSFGKGATGVVLIHGWICDHSFWIRNIPALSAEYRVIAMDLPGHGGSDGPKVEYSQQYFANAVDAVLRDAKVSRAVLVGHNMGAPVARQFVADFPAKVAGLVLVDAAISTLADAGELEKRKARRLPFLESLRSAAYPEIAGKFIDRMLVPETPMELRARIKPRMLATPQWISVSAIDGMSNGSMWASRARRRTTPC